MIMATKSTQKAGAIILSKNDENKIALLYRGKQNDWSFPKGHIEKNEDPTSTMIREIKEETGLLVRILCELPDMHYTHPDGSSVSIKMFLVQSEDDALLRPELEADAVKWVAMNEAPSTLSHENLREYFENVSRLIKK